MGQFVDITGRAFGLLTAISRVANSVASKTRWLCRCACGATCFVQSDNLIAGRQVSCGCWGHSGMRERHGSAKHGRRSGAYASWLAMRRRCESDPDYAGRVFVCERWQTFDHFLADMGDRPYGMTIDRRDNDRSYEPGNCRWATALEQSRNRRNVTITPDRIAEACGRAEHGESKRSIAVRLGISRSTVSCWLAFGEARL